MIGVSLSEPFSNEVAIEICMYIAQLDFSGNFEGLSPHAVIFLSPLFQVDVKVGGNVTIQLHGLSVGRSEIIFNCAGHDFNTTTCSFFIGHRVCVCVSVRACGSG